MIKPTFLIIAGVMALALPSVRAGWSAERRPYYTVDHMCSAAGDKQSRACFTSDFDVSSASGNFNGHHSPDGRSEYFRATQSVDDTQMTRRS